MTYEEFSAISKVLKGYYPSMQLEEYSQRLWFEAFVNYTVQEVAGAIKRYANNNRFAPSIADIKELLSRPTVKQNNACKTCEGRGYVLMQIWDDKIRDMYGDVGANDYAVTCPDCKGWHYIPRSK